MTTTETKKTDARVTCTGCDEEVLASDIVDGEGDERICIDCAVEDDYDRWGRAAGVL